MSSLRLFVAASLPGELRARVAALCQELRSYFPTARWVAPHQLHLTLRFFAALPEEYLDPLREIVLSVSRSGTPQTLSLGGLGAFPHLGRPRVLWLGLQPAEPLVHLQQQLESALGRLDPRPQERPFCPHLTIGRIRESLPRHRTLPPSLIQWRAGDWRLERLTLFHSRLGPAGAQHTTLLEAPLGPTIRS